MKNMSKMNTYCVWIGGDHFIRARTKEDVYKKLANERWEYLNRILDHDLEDYYLKYYKHLTKEKYLIERLCVHEIHYTEGPNSKLEYILVNSNLTDHILFDSCMLLSTISSF